MSTNELSMLNLNLDEVTQRRVFHVDGEEYTLLPLSSRDYFRIMKNKDILTKAQKNEVTNQTDFKKLIDTLEDIIMSGVTPVESFKTKMSVFRKANEFAYINYLQTLITELLATGNKQEAETSD